MKETFAEKEGGLSENQSGFRKTRFTNDTVNLVTSIVSDPLKADKRCAMITLDLKNVFNFGKWPIGFCAGIRMKDQNNIETYSTVCPRPTFPLGMASIDFTNDIGQTIVPRKGKDLWQSSILEEFFLREN